MKARAECGGCHHDAAGSGNSPTVAVDLRRSAERAAERRRARSSERPVRLRQANTGKRRLEAPTLRRYGGHHGVGQRDDGADCTAIGWLPVRPITGGGLRANGAGTFDSEPLFDASGWVAAKSAVIVKRRSLRDRRHRPSRHLSWKCPNDNRNWIASAKSASRDPSLMFDRNHFMPTFASTRTSGAIHRSCYKSKSPPEIT